MRRILHSSRRVWPVVLVVDPGDEVVEAVEDAAAEAEAAGSGAGVSPVANPCCRACGKPNLFAPASIERGTCAACVKTERAAS